MTRAFSWIREPVLFARVKLTEEASPAGSRPALAQANLDVDGHTVRAQVAAETIREAVDLLMDRLRQQLARANEHWEARRGGRPKPGPHQWRHGSEPTHRPDHFARPIEEREVIRHKSFAVPWESVDEAVFEMESMDYDFHLFTDVASGQDSVVCRAGPTGYRLAQLAPRTEPGPVAVPLSVSELPAPVLSLAEAEELLDNTNVPFVFFAAEATGRGNVLYHRYDGHYGLITPAGTTPGTPSGPGS
jgi:ribosome-associated translation inhibitor RaiA